MTNITSTRNRLRTFTGERDWGQFHFSKNLASILAIEAVDLLEKVQLLTEAPCRQLPADVLDGVEDKVADVFPYLIRLSDKLGIKPIAAARAKIAVNANRYSIDKAHGTRKKYNEF